MKAWPQVDQGCRLGNYESKSALCRAAALAARGWGDTHAIPLEEVAEFCDAGYLEAALALCFAAHHRIPGGDVDGIPGSDVVEGLRSHILLAARGPDGSWQTWTSVATPCTRGVYASASPICIAEALVGHAAPARVLCAEVATFCDVKLMDRDSEVCRAAYRFVQPKSDPPR